MYNFIIIHRHVVQASTTATWILYLPLVYTWTFLKRFHSVGSSTKDSHIIWAVYKNNNDNTHCYHDCHTLTFKSKEKQPQTFLQIVPNCIRYYYIRTVAIVLGKSNNVKHISRYCTRTFLKQLYREHPSIPWAFRPDIGIVLIIIWRIIINGAKSSRTGPPTEFYSQRSTKGNFERYKCQNLLKIPFAICGYFYPFQEPTKSYSFCDCITQSITWMTNSCKNPRSSYCCFYTFGYESLFTI